MKKRLEELEHGTVVLVGDAPVGEVRGVYGIGDATLAEYLAVFWKARNDEVLVPTTEVLSIEPAGVLLEGPLQTYNELSAFDHKAHPTLRRLH